MRNPITMGTSQDVLKCIGKKENFSSIRIVSCGTFKIYFSRLYRHGVCSLLNFLLYKRMPALVRMNETAYVFIA